MKYIDVEKLIAEIERWRDKVKEKYNESTYSMGRCDALAEFRNYIVSLLEEQPEVELDFQVFAKEMDAVFNLPKDVTENTEENPLNWEYAIARHFYELGRNARKK